jgi:hypothetical protein
MWHIQLILSSSRFVHISKVHVFTSCTNAQIWCCTPPHKLHPPANHKSPLLSLYELVYILCTFVGSKFSVNSIGSVDDLMGKTGDISPAWAKKNGQERPHTPPSFLEIPRGNALGGGQKVTFSIKFTEQKCRKVTFSRKSLLRGVGVSPRKKNPWRCEETGRAGGHFYRKKSLFDPFSTGIGVPPPLDPPYSHFFPLRGGGLPPPFLDPPFPSQKWISCVPPHKTQKVKFLGPFCW